MKVTVFGPVKNEADFIGYSILDCLPHVHEFIYACAKSDDGTDEILDYIKDKYAGEKLKILRSPEFDFNPHDMAAYNNAFNVCIKQASGDALWFKHPDQIVTNPEAIERMTPGPLAWWTNMTSYAGDMETEIVKGRAKRWKNIHANKFGLHYFGGYGSYNEDMYFRDITGGQHAHYEENFKAYPYRVADSGLNINHYCELKNYKRRYEKMKACLKTQNPEWEDSLIEEVATSHWRVTLEKDGNIFGDVDFKKTDKPIPDVFQKYKSEFQTILGRKA